MVAKQTDYNVKGCDILGSLWEMLTYVYKFTRQMICKKIRQVLPARRLNF